MESSNPRYLGITNDVCWETTGCKDRLYLNDEEGATANGVLGNPFPGLSGCRSPETNHKLVDL